MKRGLAAVALVACSSSAPITPDTPPTNIFTVTLIDQAVVVVPGEPTSIRLTIDATSASSATFTVGFGPLPDGLSATPVMWRTTDPSPTLVVTAAPDMPRGTIPFDVRVAQDGNIVASTVGQISISNLVGSPDPSFGVNGVVELPRTSITIPIGIAPAANGAFLVGGFDDANKRAVALRVHGDGTIDTTYGQGGFASILPSITALYATSMNASSDGRVAIGLTSGSQGAVYAFDANGGEIGETLVPFAPTALAWDGDGLFIGGAQLAYLDASQMLSIQDEHFAVDCLEVVAPSTVLAGGRFGSSDAIAKWSFSGGVFTLGTSYMLPLSMVVTDLTQDPSGRTLAAITNTTTTDVLRLDASGALDVGWGNAGVAGGIETSSEYAKVVAQPDGAALFVSSVPSGLFTSLALLGRLGSSGEIDVAFGTNGSTLTQVGKPTMAASVALDADASHAWVVGTDSSNGGEGGWVARYRLTP